MNEISGEFETLWIKYEKSLYRQIKSRFARNEEDAKDILQQTALIAYLNIGKLRFPVAARRWLSKIASSVSVDYYRKNKDYDRISETIPDEDRIETMLRNIDILNFFKGIGAGDAELLYKHLYQGMTYLELSKEKNTTVGAMKMRVYRLKLRLRDIIGDQDTGEE